MTEQQILLIKNSWSYVVVQSEEAGQHFYQRLFEVAPAVRHLFKSDSKEQGRKLMNMVTQIVTKLDKLDDIMSEIKLLAQRHAQYGAEPAHYMEKWRSETRQAWLTVYSTWSGAMIKNQKAPAIF